MKARPQYHILNGDALKEAFPNELPGTKIIARECLIEGDVAGTDLADFFATRARHISKNYDGFSERVYYEQTVLEFEKLQDIPSDAEINLWFEDDLFCQVNFWFVASLLIRYRISGEIFFVRPGSHHEHGFGGLGSSALIDLFEKRVLLRDIEKIGLLWEYYQQNDIAGLLCVADELKERHAFIFHAVNAHIERLPKEGDLGRPSNSLIEIMNDLQTSDFGQIFREFSKRERIYGFGDLQVRHLLKELNYTPGSGHELDKK